jgi:hypothetical protein
METSFIRRRHTKSWAGRCSSALSLQVRTAKVVRWLEIQN